MIGLLSRCAICSKPCWRVPDPPSHSSRQKSTEHLTNPLPYYAEHFGHKLHIDQNEKLTHVCAIDGFSRKLVGFVIMPHKKSVTINEHLYT